MFTDKANAYSFKSDVYYDGFVRNHSGGRKDAVTRPDIVALDHLSGGSLDYGHGDETRPLPPVSWGGFHEREHACRSKDSPIPFVPTSSALGLDVLATAESAIAGIVASGGTPFDRVFAIGDLPAFPANIDHNTLVLQNALLDEINDVLLDRDGDGVADADDNCPSTPNPGQEDSDSDGEGDICDFDLDNDGVDDADDNCPSIANPGQEDLDGDGKGNACDSVDNRDGDGDGVIDVNDNCRLVSNPGQEDNDSDGIGNACDDSVDGGSSGSGGGGGGFCSVGHSRNSPAPWLGLAMLGLLAMARRRRSQSC